MRISGIYQKSGNIESFIPHQLPPKDPPLALSSDLFALNAEAHFNLGKLNEMALRIPETKRFIKAYVIKEALLSSDIEGIHTTLLEVFTQPLGKSTKLNKETQLVLKYTEALEVALLNMKEEGLPIVSRVILAAHETLMSGTASDYAAPGHYRKQLVRVGDLVPAPAQEVPRLMADLEKFINTAGTLSPLIMAGLAHVQFEMIHPFLDGNGRIGRLLIVLMLIDSGLLSAPILYPSYYFKTHHQEYYQALDRVRTHGDFEGWVAYYLRAIISSAQDAHTRAKAIESLAKQLYERIQSGKRFGGKMRDTAFKTLEILFQSPIINAVDLSVQLGKSYNTAVRILTNFQDIGILVEATTKTRSRLFSFQLYLALLEKVY